MNVRYRVELDQCERDQLTALLSGGKRGARKLKRAQILLEVDRGASDEEVARSIGVGGSTVYRTKRRFVLGNLAAALNKEPRPGARRKLTGKEEALLVATACSSPPAGRSRWTLKLLAGELARTEDRDNRSRSLPPIERARRQSSPQPSTAASRAPVVLTNRPTCFREDRSEIAHDLVELARRPSENVRSPSSSGEETGEETSHGLCPKIVCSPSLIPVNHGFGRRNLQTACSRGDVNIHDLKTADEKAIGQSTSDGTVYKPRYVIFPVRGCGCEWLRDFSGWLALYCCRCGTTVFATTAPPDKPQTEQRPCRCVLQSMETPRWQTSKRTRSRCSLIGSVRSCTATIRRFRARCSRSCSRNGSPGMWCQVIGCKPFFCAVGYSAST